ncbi:MAG: glycosyltransferase family 2 protein [Fibrobacter sp.]|nr:glycosyltransferase family 2 protein [Fibrobacter sp.]
MEAGLTPLVSVLLASYNHEKYVEAAVRSVMAQQGVDFELIVIDDGSPDRSPEILDALQKELGFRYVHRPNKGLVATMNELLSMAKGKFFCSFASDDVMPPGRLAEQSSYLESHPEKPICFGQIIRMNANGVLEKGPDPRYLSGIPEVSFEDVFLGYKELHGCSEMICCDVFRDLGGYNSEFVIEDFQMMLLFLSKFSPLPVLDTVCCYYRIHDTNISNSKSWLYENTLKVLEKYRDHPMYPKAVKIWKSHWFSMLASTNKKEALMKLPQLASFSLPFLKRFPKLFIPRFILARHC